MHGVTRIFDLLQVAGQCYKAGEPVLFGKKNGEVFAVDSQTYHSNSYILAHALLESGIQKGDKLLTTVLNGIISTWLSA